MKVIVLDRDGVINIDSPDYIKSPEEWHPIPGSMQAIGELCQAGYKIAIASNQSGLARGLFDLPTLQAIHAKMRNGVAAHLGQIDHIAFCPHHPTANCDCRKPKPGLLQQIQQHFGCEYSDMVMVGDTLKDMQCAAEAGVRGVIVDTGYVRVSDFQQDLPVGTEVCRDLAAVARKMCEALKD